MNRVALRAVAVLLLPALLIAVASGCGGRPGTAEYSRPGEPGSTAGEPRRQAGGAARQANLRMIDSAVQQYFVTNGEWPTVIGQLAPYFSRGIPADPEGGTYCLVNAGGEVKAAVR